MHKVIALPSRKTLRATASETLPEVEAQHRALLAAMTAGASLPGDVLQALLDAIPNPFFMKDVGGRYLGCNAAFERYLGLGRAQIVGKTVYDVSPKELADRYFDADRELLEHPGTQVYETNVRWADGSLRDVIFHKATLVGAEGRPIGLTGIIFDITEHRRMEEALRQSEQQYRTLVEHIPDLIVRYDTELRRTYVNPAWERASGLTADEVIGVAMTDIPRVPQPVAGEYLAALRQALATGTRQSVEFAWVNARGETLNLQYVVVPEFDAAGRIVGLVAVGRDESDHARTEEALRNSESHLHRVNRALRTLSAGNETLVRATSEQELFDDMCRVMVDVGGHVMAFIGNPARDGLHVEVKAWAGSLDTGLRECVQHGICRPLVSALERNRPVVIHDMARDPDCRNCGGRLRTCGVGSGVILPLQSEGERLGALFICSNDLAAFDDDEVALLSELGGDLAYGICALRNRLGREDGLRRVQATMEATIQALASTVEFRDPYTAGHQRRVGQLAMAIGREMDLAEDRLNGLYLAAIVHDIGKIRVPAEVLTRPGKLSAIEYDMVKTHVEAGYDILKSIDFPWPIADIVLQHHERLNGSGYPAGIGTAQILPESRILAVADVVEAIASFRPYRPALGVDKALTEIEAGRDILFDGQVVDACIRQFREKNFAFE
jgi:PAS domain S-box-containing protein